MTDKSNRGPIGRASSPAPEEICAVRKAAGLTQTAAAVLLHTTCRVVQQWEAGDRRMHPAFMELLKLKTAHITRTATK
jgi:DNA-binding transcriptional regulator YiaG